MNESHSSGVVATLLQNGNIMELPQGIGGGGSVGFLSQHH